MPSTFNFQHTYAEELPDFIIPCAPTPALAPELLVLNSDLAEELQIDTGSLTPEVAASLFSGNELPTDAQTVAQAYAGHQFGGFVPQLGDGRALLLGEVIGKSGQRFDVAFKGSGPTPFSRGGDGKAAIGPVLREYLIGEAMHALGIPTTRALAAVRTGDLVTRERRLPGAVLTRVAASHIRVGTFQFFAAREQFELVRSLADYAIKRHDPGLQDEPDRYLMLLKSVADRQAKLVAQWMLVGFIHGVMNTDNTTISGETIDYGPCAFMENYKPLTVFSSIDTYGRYAYMNQPKIANWNLARFAETLLPLFDREPEQAVEVAMEVINGFLPKFEAYWLEGMRKKLGLLSFTNDDDEADRQLAEDWLSLMEEHSIDFTLGWYNLVPASYGHPFALKELFKDNEAAIDPWLERYRARVAQARNGEVKESIKLMLEHNPLFIPRNHLVEEALTAASDNADLKPFELLLSTIQKPFNDFCDPKQSKYWQPAPREFTSCYRTYCGT